LNDKITKIRTDFKNLKKENQNLKDSNENHIFINEKLNQALKKATVRIEDLEKRLSSNDSGSGLAVSNSQGEDSD
jgi:predicted RNase H-like nuclease (RuvC/YqgF family)